MNYLFGQNESVIIFSRFHFQMAIKLKLYKNFELKRDQTVIWSIYHHCNVSKEQLDVLITEYCNFRMVPNNRVP